MTTEPRAGYRVERFKRWTWQREGSTGWNWRLRFWRAQMQLTVMRHRSALSSPDRWVIQPHFIYDRKEVAR